VAESATRAAPARSGRTLPVLAQLALAVPIAVALLCACAGAAAAGSHPLQTAFQDPALFQGPPAADIAATRMRLAGATWVRVDIGWDEIAPNRPANPADPADPAYDWSGLDGGLVQIAANHLEPFVNVSEAPAWAERPAGGRAGTNNPDPVALRQFVTAAAIRYSGTYAGLPRVRGWEAWNEPNASFFFSPQWKDKPGGQPLSPVLYRRLVNEFAAGVHDVNPDNLVIAGSTFPFVVDRPDVQAIGPMRFMRELLCISKRLQAKPHCGEPIHFDAWSHHPYTAGSPTHRAANPDSASIRDLPRMQRLLGAAVKQGRVISSRPVAFWVTEFGWDTNPPDPHGVPLQLHARWVSEALFRMWSAGVSVVSWFFLRDGAGADARFQDGLYFRCPSNPGDIACDRPKLSLEAFRFPFVAFRRGGRVLIWGRTPGGVPATVAVERSRRGRWIRVKIVRTDRYGIFVARPRVRGYRTGSLRARLVRDSQKSLPFSLKRPTDFPISPPVG
jgi:hypothetical protein